MANKRDIDLLSIMFEALGATIIDCTPGDNDGQSKRT